MTGIKLPPTEPRADRGRRERSKTIGVYLPPYMRGAPNPTVVSNPRGGAQPVTTPRSSYNPRPAPPSAPRPAAAHNRASNGVPQPSDALQTGRTFGPSQGVPPPPPRGDVGVQANKKHITFDLKANRPPPPPPTSNLATGIWAGAARFLGREVVPEGCVKCKVTWYCPIPSKDPAFIQETSHTIAGQCGANVICIRSAIHGTTFVPGRNARGGRDEVEAPWHYTVEFQHKDTKKWIHAHVYTDTRRVGVDKSGREVFETVGLKEVDNIEIFSNPEIWHRERHAHKAKEFGHYDVVLKLDLKEEFAKSKSNVSGPSK